MRRRPELYEKLKQDLLSDFTEMSETIENGAQKYTLDYILSTMELKYYMTSQNIMKLIKEQLRKNDETPTHTPPPDPNDNQVREGLFASQDSPAGTL